VSWLWKNKYMPWPLDSNGSCLLLKNNQLMVAWLKLYKTLTQMKVIGMYHYTSQSQLRHISINIYILDFCTIKVSFFTPSLWWFLTTFKAAVLQSVQGWWKWDQYPPKDGAWCLSLQVKIILCSVVQTVQPNWS